MKKKALLLSLLFVTLILQAANDLYRYRIYLRDKGGVNIHSVNPALSAEALERRARQSIVLDSTDLPVFASYLDSIRSKGFPVISQSHWMNTVVVSVDDTTRINLLRMLPFVTSARLVWINYASASAGLRAAKILKDKFHVADTVSPYGQAQTQIEMLGLKKLHDKGFKGKGITIAVLDAGFLGADTISYFKNVKIKAVRDFVQPATTVYNGHYHGTAVLSQMAVNDPGVFMGTAPEATYCLLRSEENVSEFPIEEDYWAAAAEYADSLGANVINSSLGYYNFDNRAMDYTQNQLDGKTGFVTSAASMAASKGILVVNSAGNEGANSWRKICFPADAPDVLTVGAINSGFIRSYFSSLGPTADGRIKPDVVALGSNNRIIIDNGSLAYGSGTSYASPLVAGMVASIWSGVPQVSAAELRSRIISSSDRYAHPDTLYGYGLPNAYTAWSVLSTRLSRDESTDFSVYPTRANNTLMIQTKPLNGVSVCVKIYNIQGVCVKKQTLVSALQALDISALPVSVYLVELLENGARKAAAKIQICR